MSRSISSLLYNFFFFFFLAARVFVVAHGLSLAVVCELNCPASCGMLVPGSGIEFRIPVKQILKHWTPKLSPTLLLLKSTLSLNDAKSVIRSTDSITR